MADVQNRVAQYDELLRRFASGVRAAQLYAADHPLIGRNIEGLLAILKSLHALQASIAVGIVGTQLVVSDTPMTKASQGMVELIKRLKDHKIERIAFERGITAEETSAFMHAVARLGKGERPKPRGHSLTSGWPHHRRGKPIGRHWRHMAPSVSLFECRRGG